MTARLLFKIKPYIQPFELHLALAELESLSRTSPKQLNNNTYQVETFTPKEIFIQNLAYWEIVTDDISYPTVQILRESTTNVVRNGVPLETLSWSMPLGANSPLPNRRILRYGTHGIHEYRGKFFPQLVRSLINIAEVPEDGLLADPMCGSGTTIVEAILSGRFGVGLDLNPLSVLMSQTKCDLLSVSPSSIILAYQSVRDRILKLQGASDNLLYFESLPAVDQHYLRLWFSEQVLSDIDQIKRVIDNVDDIAIKNFFIIVLSNILRKVSWQKDEDLRIRKEIKPDADLDPFKEFLDDLGKSVRTVLAFLYQIQSQKIGKHFITIGNAVGLSNIWQDYSEKIDCIITSPPYATALPYLDTDRLSLCYLGLLSHISTPKYNLSMIGNREITEKIRQSLWQTFQLNKHELPINVIDLIAKIDSLNSNSKVGFRRRNLPVLLYKYFSDMQSVFCGMFNTLKPGSPAYIVIGNNHTIAGGEKVDIDTTSLLADCASNIGFTEQDRIPMEMLVSRDIFKKNAVATEYILCLRKP